MLVGLGRAAGVFAAWKTAQTLAEALSGIATVVARIAAAAEGTGRRVPVACTRKNFPGTRTFSARAVTAGGGILHRLGTSETLLVFPQHLALVPDAERAALLSSLRRAQPEKRVVVEGCSREDALVWARLGAEILQLERFPPQEVRALRGALDAARLDVKLAPAGGIDANNAADYARAGADLLVTSAPYFAPPADVVVTIGPVPEA
jgi:molybdenum transport protein